MEGPGQVQAACPPDGGRHKPAKVNWQHRGGGGRIPLTQNFRSMIVLSLLDFGERKKMRPILHLSVLLLCLVSIASDSARLCAQTAGETTTRQRAFELFKQGKHLEALPLFEELALKSPDD